MRRSNISTGIHYPTRQEFRDLIERACDYADFSPGMRLAYRLAGVTPGDANLGRTPGANDDRNWRIGLVVIY